VGGPQCGGELGLVSDGIKGTPAKNKKLTIVRSFSEEIFLLGIYGNQMFEDSLWLATHSLANCSGRGWLLKGYGVEGTGPGYYFSYYTKL
jgi:hypothetical protein